MKTVRQAPVEPVLPMCEIQGIVVPGFFKPHQTLVGVQFPPAAGALRKIKAFLRNLADEVSTAELTLADRRLHRLGPSAVAERAAETFVAVALSYRGLRRLTRQAEMIPGEAFRLDLQRRSRLLGDPSTGPGSVGTWTVGARGVELDALLIVAGDDRPSVTRRTGALARLAEVAGLSIVYRENGDVRPDHPGHEHFGFNDGVSQPGIRGRASSRHDDFITDRHIALAQVPQAYLFGYPGQDLVWPGVLVLGHPATSPDPLIAGPVARAVPPWTTNGSFLVFRRLVQDVGLFWRTMRSKAKHLSKYSGFAGIDEDWLAARLVGRWASGAPVNRLPVRDNSSLGRNQSANNHFRFDSNSKKLRLTSGYQDPFPMSVSDPAGVICPWAAHIRKTNTRDSSSDTGGRDSTYVRRLLRVGVPFGPPLTNRYASKAQDQYFGKRGLLFLSIQASIEEQFEFLVSRWMGDPSRPKMPGGHDLLVGQNDAADENRVRRSVIFGAQGAEAEIETNAQWIVPTGGGYFFVPSISCLRNIA